jgi:hypothetical protein
MLVVCDHCGESADYENFDIADESRLLDSMADGEIDEDDFYGLLSMHQCPNCQTYVDLTMLDLCGS